MSIRFQCPNCGKDLKLADSSAGQRGKCPFCHTKIIVPSAITSSSKSSVITLKCIQCGQPIFTDERILDEPMTCGDCGTPILVDLYPVLAKMRKDRDAIRKAERDEKRRDHDEGKARLRLAVQLEQMAAAPPVLEPSEKPSPVEPSISLITIRGKPKWIAVSLAAGLLAAGAIYLARQQDGEPVATIIRVERTTPPGAEQDSRRKLPDSSGLVEEAVTEFDGVFADLSSARKGLEGLALWMKGPPEPAILRGRPLRKATFTTDASNSLVPGLDVYLDEGDKIRAFTYVYLGPLFYERFAANLRKDEIRTASETCEALDMLVGVIIGGRPMLSIGEAVFFDREPAEDSEFNTGRKNAETWSGVKQIGRVPVEFICWVIPPADPKKKDFTQRLYRTIVIVKDGTW